MSPIEHLWPLMKNECWKKKKELKKEGKKIKKDDLWSVIKEVLFSEESNNLVKKLYESMPSRI